LNKQEQPNRANEILNSTIDPTGQHDQPVIAAVMSKEKFAEGSNVEAANIAIALKELLSGQKMMGEEVARIRQHMAKIDEDAHKWEEDRQKFLDDLRAQGDKLRVTGERLDSLKAGAVDEVQRLVAEAKAEIPNDRKRFDEDVARSPKVKIASPGKLIMVREQGAIVGKIIPEEVRIKHRIWVLPPGQEVEVPQIVADTLRSRRLSEQETQERKDVLQSNLEDKEVAKRMSAIDKKYRSSTDTMPVR